MTDVFLSYSHEDAGVADAVCGVLDELGIVYFRDEKAIVWGDSIDSEVRLGLDQTKVILVIASPASLKSWWVSYEVGYAVGQRKRVLPYLTHRSLDLPPYLSHLKHCSTVDEVRAYFATGVVHEARPVDEEGPEAASLLDLQKLMPDLLAEMKQDLADDKTGVITEFVILPSKTVVFSGGKARFAYYENEHANLQNKIDMLNDRGLVRDITTGNTPTYGLTEEFRAALRSL